MTADELKPCPFCGGEAFIREDTSHSTAFFVGCSDWDCFGNVMWDETEAEARRKWNTRAETTEVIALRKREARLVEALKRITWVLDDERGAMEAAALSYARTTLAEIEKEDRE